MRIYFFISSLQVSCCVLDMALNTPHPTERGLNTQPQGGSGGRPPQADAQESCKEASETRS